MNELIGIQINHYELVELLGTGGMGAVYRARDNNLQRDVALKLLLRQEEATEELSQEGRRLQDEAKAASRLQLAHLVHVLDSGYSDKLGPYIVYELLPGPSLRHYLRTNGALGVETFERLIRPLLQTLHSLHQAGIVHRDVKPENLLAGPDGLFALGDLGLAYFEGRQAQTKTGCVIGSPGYLAPEVFSISSSPGPEQDCYSAAVVIVEALTGKRLFTSGNAADLVKEQFTWMPQANKLVSLGVPKSTASVLVRALSLNASERPNAEELLKALEGPVDSNETLLVPTIVNEKKPKAKKTRANHVLAIVICSFLLAAIYVVSNYRGKKVEHENVRMLEPLVHLPRPEQMADFLEDTERFLTELRSQRPNISNELWQSALSRHSSGSIGPLIMKAKRKLRSGDKAAAFALYRDAAETQHYLLLKQRESEQSKYVPLETLLLTEIYLHCPDRDCRINTLAKTLERFADFSLTVKHCRQAYNHYRHIVLLVAIAAFENNDPNVLALVLPSLRTYKLAPPNDPVVAHLSQGLIERLVEKSLSNSSVARRFKKEIGWLVDNSAEPISLAKIFAKAQREFDEGRSIYTKMQNKIASNIMELRDTSRVGERKKRCAQYLERSVWTSTTVSYIDKNLYSRLPNHAANQLYAMRTDILPMAQLYIGDRWTESLSRRSSLNYGILDLERLGLLVKNSRESLTQLRAEALYADSLLAWFRAFHQTDQDFSLLVSAVQASSSNAPTHYFAKGCQLVSEGKKLEGYSLQKHGLISALERAKKEKHWGESWLILARIATWRWALLRRDDEIKNLVEESRMIVSQIDEFRLEHITDSAQRFTAIALVTLGHGLLRSNRTAELLTIKKRLAKLDGNVVATNVMSAAKELIANRALVKSLYLY